MNKKLIVLVVALALLVAAIGVAYFALRPQPTEGMKSFTVTIVHKDGTTKDLSMESDEEFLGTVLQAEGIVKGDMGEYGLYIKEVDGEKAVYEEDNGYYWAFFVDGKSAATGIDQTPIVDGAVYKLVCTNEFVF